MNFNGDITSVELVFENCEVINIERKNILWAHIGGEHNQLTRCSNSLYFSECLKEFGIVIRNSVLTELSTFGSTMSERISVRDVTHVTFCDTCGNTKTYALDWVPEGMECQNNQYSIYQRVQFTPNGHLIFISTVASMIQVDVDNIDDSADWVY